ncbi:hypothetical protein RSSM_01575 [Rhodopirellula sallentina SM41]|uniref:Uncharacterized protein n=1 Tax=Rhodopirellula sallentina SM41 TaxID=1263870 RepID=M5UGK7_9BACT|nr:hypothetical protein RSSM_01575 [Rhodopirellula sallentina SM41]
MNRFAVLLERHLTNFHFEQSKRLVSLSHLIPFVYGGPTCVNF